MTTSTLPIKFGALIASQGGFFAAIMRGHTVNGIEQPPYALIVSPQTTGETNDCQWGAYGQEIEGAGSRTNGRANTAAMAAAECHAALAIHGKEIEGHSDWHLPSLGELNSAAANVPELFEKDGVYWTSTQDSRYGAFAQVFEYGHSGWLSKDDEFRARAFRAIPLELLTA